MRTWCDIARIVATKNLDGGLTVKCDGSSPFFAIFGEGEGAPCDDIALYAVPPRTDCPRVLHVRDLRVCADGCSLVVHFDEVESVDVAHKLIGCRLLVAAQDLPLGYGENLQDDAVEDLIGWTLYDETSGIHAKIVDAVQSFEQVLLYVVLTEDAAKKPPTILFDSAEGTADAIFEADAQREFMVPLVDEFIIDVNREVRHLDCVLPRGLFEL